MPSLPRSLPTHWLLFGVCLTVCTYLTFYDLNARAAVQTTCQVDCTATVPGSAAVESNVAFAATSTTTDCATPVTYEWDFGDGKPRATNANATHSYTAPGTYTWRMTARANSGGATPAQIDTIAGGYGEGLTVKQAAFSRPTALTRDPLGRGVYVFDQAISGDGLRFINTNAVDVTLAGKLIAPGTSRSLTTEYVTGTPSTLYLTVVGMAASLDGNILFISNASPADILAFNVSNNPQTVFGTTLTPGKSLSLPFTNSFSLARQPNGIAVHPQTGQVYFSDGAHVFKLAGTQPAQIVAGSGEATRPTQPFPGQPVPALNVPLLQARDLLFDAAGTLYIADAGHGRVIKLNPDGQLALVAQLPFQNSGFFPVSPFPSGLALFNGSLFAATGNQQTVLQLTGPGVTQPVTIAGAANVACTYGNGNCGDGGAVAGARFNLPGQAATPYFVGLEADANGLYILDQSERLRGRIRYLNLSSTQIQLAGTIIPGNQVATIAGTGAAPPFDNGPALGAALTQPSGLTLDANGNLWFADTHRGTLRFVNRGTQPITIFANTPAAQTVEAGHIVTVNKDVAPNAPNNIAVNQATFETPQGMVATSQGIFLADTRKGPARTASSFNGYGLGERQHSSLIRFINTGNQDVTFYQGTAHQVIVPKGFVGTIAGGGESGTTSSNPFQARLIGAIDIAISPITNDLYVSSVTNIARIRRLNGDTAIVLGGASGTSYNQSFSGIEFDASGRLLVLQAFSNKLFRQQNPENVANNSFVPLLAGAPLNSPRDVALDAAGNIYVTNVGTSQILKITQTGSTVTTQVLAGSTPGFSGDSGLASNAQLNLQAAPVPLALATYYPAAPALVGIISSPGGEIFFADSRNQRIRRISENATACVKTGTITITGNAPLPTLSQLSPATAYVAQPFTLTVNGSGFGPSSQILWNGTQRATTFVSATQLLATIPASDLTIAGSANVTVANPAPGGGTSSALTLTIIRTSTLPALERLEPSQVALNTSFRLTITGINFTPTSVVRWEGQPRNTLYVNAETLQVDVPASETSSVALVSIQVFKPGADGGLSTPAYLQIGCPAIQFAQSTLPFAPFQSSYSQTLRLLNAASPYKLIVSSGSLPPGLTLTAEGVLSGMATTLGTYRFTVLATDAFGCTGSQSYTLEVKCGFLFSPSTLPSAMVAIFYSETISATHGQPPFSFSLGSGGLPPGLSLNANGTLNGAPTLAGEYTFTVKATSASGCTDERSYTLLIKCNPSEITPGSLPEGAAGAPYSVRFSANGNGKANFSVTAGVLPLGLTLDAGGLLSGIPKQGGNYPLTLTAISVSGCVTSCSYTLQISGQPLAVEPEARPCADIGSSLPFKILLNNNTAVAQNSSISITPLGSPENCTASIGRCGINSPLSIYEWFGILQPGQTVVIQFQVQISNSIPPNTPLCTSVTGSLGAAGSFTAQNCSVSTCLALGPGQNIPFSSELDDQGTGSVLLFNLYTSEVSNPNQQNTRLSLTNVDQRRNAYVHLFFVDGASCAIADSYICLTPNQTTAFLASDIDPGTTGFLIAVATDQNGWPINFNYLMGEAYVKLSSGHRANLGAEAIKATSFFNPFYDKDAATVELHFDPSNDQVFRTRYGRLPRVLALSNIGSLADGNNTLLVINRIGGNLATGAATLTDVFGILYDDAEAPFSFGFSPGTCQFRGIVTNNFPRTAPRFGQVIPTGRSGWLKLSMQSEGAVSGVALNFNTNAATSSNAFNQGRNLHKLTLTTAATLTVPVFPPSC